MLALSARSRCRAERCQHGDETTVMMQESRVNGAEGSMENSNLIYTVRSKWRVDKGWKLDPFIKWKLRA